MKDGVRRNDPCPCGSGKRYKACCLGKSAKQDSALRPHSGGFRFEPGSYGGPGRFMPSIACLKQTRPGQWQYHFVLVRTNAVVSDEDAASRQAEQDLRLAFSDPGESIAERVPETLKTLGYLSVDGFQGVDGS